jgi:hypothetical protein
VFSNNFLCEFTYNFQHKIIVVFTQNSVTNWANQIFYTITQTYLKCTCSQCCQSLHTKWYFLIVQYFRSNCDFPNAVFDNCVFQRGGILCSNFNCIFHIFITDSHEMQILLWKKMVANKLRGKLTKKFTPTIFLWIVKTTQREKTLKNRYFVIFQQSVVDFQPEIFIVKFHHKK